MSPSRWKAKAVGSAAVLVLVLAPLVFAALFAKLGSAPVVENVVEPVPATIVLEPSSDRLVASVDLTVTVRVLEPPATSGEGIVTAIYLEPGDTLRAGAPLFALNGVQRLGYVPRQSQVFYRTLCAGSRGSDVALLQEFLSNLGYAVSTPDGRFGRETENAVKLLNADLGYPSPHACFEPATVIALPSEEVTVASLGLVLGQPFAATTPWVTLRPAVDDARVSLTGGALVPDGAYELRVNGHAFPAEVAAGTVSVDEPSALDVLTMAPGTSMFRGSLQSVNEVPMILLPATSILLTADGKTCVAVKEPAGNIVAKRVTRLPNGVRDLVAVAPDASLEGATVILAPSVLEHLSECR